mmetsp:Transcript_77176/g.208369  ORF Transcript_77176/g.208369 Transcript_77176/m.208369 type:complete len:125 (-) Transcript_77176:109-483(-)
MASKPKEETKEEDPFKTLMRLSSKNPNSVAFMDFTESKISAEQRLLEMKFETAIEQFNELQRKRIAFWSTPTGPTPLLLDNLDPPNLLELRKQRLSELTSVSKAFKPADMSCMQNSLLEVAVVI